MTAAAAAAAAVQALLRSICPGDIDDPVVVPARHSNPPGIAAHFAILHEAAGNIRLHVDLQCLAAVWTGDQELVRHAWSLKWRAAIIRTAPDMLAGR